MLENWQIVGIVFIFGIVLCSFLEYAIHKFLLHSTPKFLRKVNYIRSMWKGHVVSHHANYIPDDHYTKDKTNEKEVLTFSWFEGFLIVGSMTLITYGVAATVRIFVNLPVYLFLPEVIGFAVSYAVYYVAYESLHAIMHVPYKWKWLCKKSVVKMLNRHHYQHHLDPGTNLNVILPIADYVFGTKKSLPMEKHKFADAYAY